MANVEGVNGETGGGMATIAEIGAGSAAPISDAGAGGGVAIKGAASGNLGVAMVRGSVSAALRTKKWWDWCFSYLCATPG